jgi:hypothetical protein
METDILKAKDKKLVGTNQLSEDEYDLFQSTKALGKLYPILKDKRGNIIDGFHRQNADPRWPTVTVKEIDTDEKLELARLVTNYCRRTMDYHEINRIISYLVKQGLKPEEISVQTGIHISTIYRHMPQELKDQDKSKAISQGRQEQIARATSREAMRAYNAQDKREIDGIWAEHSTRVREEVKQELLKDSSFQLEVLKEIAQRTEQKVDLPFDIPPVEEQLDKIFSAMAKIKPTIVKATDPCPSSVCKLPSMIDAGPELDVRAESIAKFFENNLKCRCKHCIHYEKCGVFY